MDSEAKLFFRDQFREARAVVLGDSEAYESIVLVLERIGRYLVPQARGMGQQMQAVCGLAAASPLAYAMAAQSPDFHMDFTALYESVRKARNAAVHEGALARHLAVHALEMALVLEDALMTDMGTAGEFMVRGPATAALWQPLSFVRQLMLANSFSYLPVQTDEAQGARWHLVSDVSLARALRNGETREAQLKTPLGEAVAAGTIELHPARTVHTDTTIESIIMDLDEVPVLVVSKKEAELLGIVTAFDLL